MLGGSLISPSLRTRLSATICSFPALLSIFLIISPVSSMWPFQPKRFTKNSLMQTGSMGLGDGDRIVAFGDFNGDQFVDVLALDSDQQVLSVYLWKHDEFVFEENSRIRHPAPIYNVIPGDFTLDGKLDLLVMSANSANTLDMTLYKGNHDGTFESTPISTPSSTLSQPISVDINGDMNIDLLGMVPSEHSPSNLLKAWKNTWNGSQSQPTPFELIDAPFHGAQCSLASPHSNAIIDLNGDCLADVFLVCDEGQGRRSFQIWVNNKDSGFSLAEHEPLPSGVQAISFADIDRDGTIDMVFPTCSSVSSRTGIGSGCLINIAYNKQLPLCPSATSTSTDKQGNGICRPPEQLCTADPNFGYDLSLSGNNDIPLSSLVQSPSSSLLVLDTTFSPALPLPIRLGDANLDGFPDLLLISATGGVHTPKLLFSEPCTKGLPGCDENGQGRRGFGLVTRGAEDMESVRDARGATFFDMDEDGTLDIVIQRTGGQGQGTVSFIQNNFYYDAFFLKAVVLNGACNNGWCTTPNGSSYLPFGVSYSGASYKYTVLDTSGRRSAAQVGQLPQTSYHSLLTPYSFFGLGRTNNYIENLFVGSTKHIQEHFINMEGVIPNSRVVIHPPPGLSEGSWKRELYLRPGEWIPWVTLTVVVTTAILAIIVFVLHLNEKREDELERRRASHHINFDAL
ncbi:hypothetical protein PAXRUDRAFT_632706 [Paxillus rubicundulus Ve08.2h10]|uniref:T-cell immunomodulatory protein TIP C2 domain-containing protein n=1 Tax=Paxillus rubicundulus Ve08.2h10 TaxID=930991 RepID=A0A0D0DVH7_9AGAM|nr:hypothetical protein PAXRUDRAFT_632706 [Paxillus rubicundulus Ve08.2h10]